MALDGIAEVGLVEGKMPHRRRQESISTERKRSFSEPVESPEDITREAHTIMMGVMKSFFEDTTISRNRLINSR